MLGSNEHPEPFPNQGVADFGDAPNSLEAGESMVLDPPADLTPGAHHFEPLPDQPFANSPNPLPVGEPVDLDRPASFGSVGDHFALLPETLPENMGHPPDHLELFPYEPIENLNHPANHFQADPAHATALSSCLCSKPGR